MCRGTEAGAQGGKCIGGAGKRRGVGEIQKNYKILHNTFQSKLCKQVETNQKGAGTRIKGRGKREGLNSPVPSI